MKKLIAIMMMLLPMLAWGQKIVKNGTDPFTNQIAIETSMEGLLNRNKFKNQWNEVKVALRYDNGTWSVPASILMDKTQYFNPDCLLVLRLSNGRVITLNANSSGEAMNSERGALGAATQTRVAPFQTVYLGLTDDDIEALQEYPITNMRITSEMTKFDYEIKGKSSEVFKRMIKLVDDALHK